MAGMLTVDALARKYAFEQIISSDSVDDVETAVAAWEDGRDADVVLWTPYKNYEHSALLELLESLQNSYLSFLRDVDNLRDS